MEQPDIDSHKLIYHPERVAEWKEKEDCFPVYVEIGPTNGCNHRCIFCALDWIEHGTKFIDSLILNNCLKEMAEHGVKSVMFAGEGEPLLHKNISEFVETAKRSNIDVSITTNGILFDEEKAKRILHNLSWIRFSVDAGTKESYSKIHRTLPEDFDKVIENIKRAAEIKKEQGLKTTIGVQFLLIPDNVNEAIKIAETCKEIGADNLQIKPYSQHPLSKNKFVINYKDYEHLAIPLEKLNSDKFKVIFRKRTIERLHERTDYDECHGMPFFALIDAHGNIIPCNLFYNNPEFVYGNLYEESFSEIWASERRKQVLKKLRTRGIRECREACRLDSVNRYLERLKNPHPHDNFI